MWEMVCNPEVWKKDVWMVYDKEAEDAEAGKEAGGTDQKKNSLSK